jgi:FkbM family methyltransferase
MSFHALKQLLKQDSVIGGFFYGFVRHLIWLTKSPEYRRYAYLVARYSHFSRFKRTTIKLNGRLIDVPDVASFLSTYQELFVNKIYKFDSKKENPVILDFGANIGLSIIYFKSLYPSSTVIAYEADPNIFQSLTRNVGDLPGVILHNKAIWNENTTLSFHSEGADGGCIGTQGEKGLINVDAVNVVDVLDSSNADFIKMDIEGAESIVLPACKGKLDKAQHIFCEYHSRVNEQQELDSILTTLRNEGFRIHIQSINPSHRPFVGHEIDSGFDMQLNIFGWKEC